MSAPPSSGGRGTAKEPYELPDEEEPYELPAEPDEYDLLILNDDIHTFDYVAVLLRDVFGMTREEGFALATEIDARGRAVVFTGSWKQVERKRAQIVGYGPDQSWWLADYGPMKVEIRAASSPGDAT
jgi:ATP-dependent Clp protease adaptor protein ClpS